VVSLITTTSAYTKLILFFRKMEIKDFTLKPKAKLMKYLILPFLAYVGFIIYTFLKGFGSSNFKSTKPMAIELGLPLWEILIIALALFVIANLFFKILFNKEEDKNSEILITKKDIIIHNSDYKMSFNRKKAKHISISISKFWGILFKKYYRVGRLKIKYQGDSYIFLFPVRDMEIESIIHAQKI